MTGGSEGTAAERQEAARPEPQGGVHLTGAGSDERGSPGGASVRATLPVPDRRRLIRINAVIFLLTFLAYWLAGPMRTEYDFQLSQANNIIHGHLDMTEQYTHNLGVLERVLYDGIGFCIPLNDPRGPDRAQMVENPRITADCRHYMQHSLGPALLLIPLVLVDGLDVNQTMVSAFFGALTALIAFGIARRFSDNLRTQLFLTALAAFGTQLWYSAADGSVWHFAHTTAVFFVFAAIYATVALRSPLLAGAFVGAAFMCRPTTILAGLFPLVAFSDRWLVAAAGQALWRRLRIRPLVQLAIGVAPFVLLTGVLNALRFGSPFESGYSYSEQVYQTYLASVYNHGIFDISYIPRHVAVFFEGLPNFANHGPFVWPSWFGQALWATSPPLLYALFVHLRRYRRVALFGAGALGLACAAMLIPAAWNGLRGAPPPAAIPLGLNILPFWVLIAAAIVAALAFRDRIALACWAAIIAIASLDWMFAATGWAQFGYRYGLDFMPFLFLLVVLAVRERVRWQHLLLLGIAVAINLWATLWIFKFAPAQLFGWTWVSF